MELFSPIGPREYYRTVGSDELALSLSTAMSYRKTIRFLNRVRWQTEKGTPMTTLANIVEIEGTQAQQELERQAQHILMEHQFDQIGTPQKAEHTYGLLPVSSDYFISLTCEIVQVENLQENKKEKAISGSIIALSHVLGIEVVAEGVETGEQFEYLKKIGCDIIQGYYINKPLSLDDYNQLLLNQA
jgi:EAL domain-containing protein (putative c-di-GMP-specific phosphodiesterase class I)